MSSAFWLMFGSLFSGLSVAFGAFGAHALKNRVDSYYLEIFETGARYQMYHGLALIGLAFASSKVDDYWLKVAGFLMIFGTIVFSGSLYTLVFTGVKKWGAVTPIGGSLLLISWTILFAISFSSWMKS